MEPTRMSLCELKFAASMSAPHCATPRPWMAVSSSSGPLTTLGDVAENGSLSCWNYPRGRYCSAMASSYSPLHFFFINFFFASLFSTYLIHSARTDNDFEDIGDKKNQLPQ